MPQRCVALLLVVFAALASGCAHSPGTFRPYAGLTYHIETRYQPAMRLFVAEVDLRNPRVHVRVLPGGPDPDGPGKWETVLTRPTKIAVRERLDLVVNGDFFSARKTNSAKVPNAKLSSDMWAVVAGPAVTDGKAWADAVSERPCLVVHKNKKVDIEMLAHGTPDDWEVIAGNIILVKDGVVVSRPSKTINPRTAVGIDAKGRTLIILVVDGRQPGVSIGLSDADMGAEMLRLGCRQALNLDGGGSSVMAVRDPATGQMRILNIPSDGHERPVADILGISVDSRRH